MSQNLRNYTKALYGFDAVVARVPTDRWDDASPCDDWCARDVVAHVAGVTGAITQMARTGQMAMPGTPDGDGDVAELWHTARDNVLEALDHPHVLDQQGPFWFDMESIDDLLGFTQWDPLIHSWDLGQATGLDAHASQDVAQAAIDVIASMGDTLRAMGIMGQAVEVPADSDPLTKVLGLTGRNPLG